MRFVVLALLVGLLGCKGSGPEDAASGSDDQTVGACRPADDCTIASATDDRMLVTCKTAPLGLDGEPLGCRAAGEGQYDCPLACIRTAGHDCEVCVSSRAFQCPSAVTPDSSCATADDSGRICCL